MAQSFATPRLERAAAYIDDVLAARVIVGTFERLAIERHAHDMARSEGWRPPMAEGATAPSGSDWPFIFDPLRAERACRAVEEHHHVEGEWAGRGERLRLEGWQAFVVASLFGWVHRETGYRRFDYAYLEVARKNAKSTLLAALGNVLAFLDNEPGAQVFSAATSERQAMAVFGTARQMVLKSDKLRGVAGVMAMARKLLQPGTNSKFEVLAGQTHTHDGLNVHAALVDELHEHKDRTTLDVLSSGTGARRQPMILIITTAGAALAGVCWEERCVIDRILHQLVRLDNVFGMIFAIDDDDDPFDQTVWRKANPNLGISIQVDALRKAAEKAMASPAEKGEFLRKRCCRWSAHGQGAFNLEAWQATAVDRVKFRDLADLDRVVLGVDGSQNDDFSAIVAAGYDCKTLLVAAELHATQLSIEAQGSEHLAVWRDQGWIVEHEGALIDYAQLGDAVETALIASHAAELNYDRLYLTATMQDLEKKHGEGAGGSVVFIQQSPAVFALDPGVRSLQGLIIDRRVRHDRNPVMAWMVGNARARLAGEGLKLFKSYPETKIDGVQALVIALARLGMPPEVREKREIPEDFEV